jgi:serine/threonine protein kinase
LLILTKQNDCKTLPIWFTQNDFKHFTFLSQMTKTYDIFESIDSDETIIMFSGEHILKISKSVSENESLEREFKIGNRLQDILKKHGDVANNFMETVDIFKAKEPYITQKKVIEDLEGEHICLVTKYIDGINISSWIDLCDSSISNDEIVAVIFQLILTLFIAADECQFTHYDLHHNNVLIKTLDEKREVSYTFRGKNYRVLTQHIPVIIDFGSSTIRLNNKTIGSGHKVPFDNVQSSEYICADIYKILMCVSKKMMPYNLELLAFIAYSLGDLLNVNPVKLIVKADTTTLLIKYNNFLSVEKKATDILKKHPEWCMTVDNIEIIQTNIASKELFELVVEYEQLCSEYYSYGPDLFHILPQSHKLEGISKNIKINQFVNAWSSFSEKHGVVRSSDVSNIFDTFLDIIRNCIGYPILAFKILIGVL